MESNEPIIVGVGLLPSNRIEVRSDNIENTDYPSCLEGLMAVLGKAKVKAVASSSFDKDTVDNRIAFLSSRLPTGVFGMTHQNKKDLEEINFLENLKKKKGW